MIIEPINDTTFLTIVHDQARADAQNPIFRDFAAKLESTRELRWLIRCIPFRWDSGDPADGPRVPGNPSQRLRRLPRDLNCVESDLMYLTLAEILAPEVPRTSATLRLNQGYHTFPVENGIPVVLDPIVPRNAMAATVDSCMGRCIRSPVRWMLDIAQHGGQPRIARRGLDELARAAMQRRPIRHRQAIEDLLAIAYEQARLWGDGGCIAYERAARQISHFMALEQLILEVR